MLVPIYRTISTFIVHAHWNQVEAGLRLALFAAPICCGPAALFQVVGKGFSLLRVGLSNLRAWPRTIFHPAKGFGLAFKDSHNLKRHALTMSFILHSLLDRLLFPFGSPLPCRLRVLAHG